MGLMMEPGPLLAAGRDADIFEYGPGLVLRRSRASRSLAEEARVMEYVRSQGYPVPAVDEVSSDGTDLVMERIEGIDMGSTMTKRPWTISRQGRTLADLHCQLHELSAPDWLRDAPGAGRSPAPSRPASAECDARSTRPGRHRLDRCVSRRSSR